MRSRPTREPSCAVGLLEEVVAAAPGDGAAPVRVAAGPQESNSRQDVSGPELRAQRRLRVLFVIKTLGPGGAERLLVNHARVGDHAEFDYEVAFLWAWLDHLVPELEKAGVSVHCLSGAKDWDLRWAWRLRTLLLRTPFDVVHMQSPYVAPVTRLVSLMLPRRSRPALVYTEHNVWPALARLVRFANWSTYRLDDATLAVSDGVRNTVPRRLRTQVEVLTHGVDVDGLRFQRRFGEEVRAELGVRDDEVLVGTVCNFRADKAYPDLLEAARIVAAAGVRAKFISVGHGPLESEVKRLHAEMGLEDIFRFAGYRADAVRVMSAFDVFTLASVREGLPVAVMEALALGLPLVATAVGGIPEAVTHGVEGFLVPPSRPERLGAAIAEVVADADLRARMGRAAEARAESFRMESAVRRTEQLYRQVSFGKRNGAFTALTTGSSPPNRWLGR